MTSLHDQRLMQVLTMNRDQVVCRFECGLISRETFDHYRTMWTQRYGKKKWDDGKLGAASVVKLRHRNDH